MAKSDTPFAELDLSKAYSPPHKPAWAEDKNVNGFDTETADGSIFMLSIAWQGFGGVVIDNDGKPLSPEAILDYMTHKRARSSLNMWYNLDFDANVVLKRILDKKELAILLTNAHVETDDFSITYVPGKFLKFKDNNRNVYTHYDASQFFYTSLDNASEEWLGKSKVSEDADVTRFGMDGETVNDYIRNNWQSIKNYARVDAELVRDLWVEAVSVGETELDIPMGRPFSTGYLAESYLNHVMLEKPGIGPREAAEMAWKTYAGGRFEVIKRGHVGPVAGPDINSAYPWVLSDLPDPKTLEWQLHESPTIQDLKDADYGFVNATVSTDASRPIQPFAIKDESFNDVLKYPALSNYEISVIKELFTNAYDYDYLTDYEIHDCWLAYDNSAHYPFDFIQPKYKERKEFEANGKMKKGMLLKIILNSMYGKTCQTTPKRKKVTEEYHLEDGEDHIPAMSLPKNIREEYENGFIEYLQAGSWFNPFIATYITGLTRLELHKRVLQYGLEENTVMMATDCLMIEKDAFDNSNFADDLVKDGLGNWDYDYAGDAFVIGAGVYEVEMPDGSRKLQSRGFREADLTNGLREAAANANGSIKIESMRPRTIGEALWQNLSLSDVGTFMDSERDLKPDMDNKRRWNRTPTFRSLLDGPENSKPILLSG